MWEHYKRTAVTIQLVIGTVTVAIFAWSGVASLAALFFVTMQIASMIGAAWAARLKTKVLRGQ